MNRIFSQKQIPWILALGVALGLGLYFRTYLVHSNPVMRPDRIMAMLLVEKTITDRFLDLIQTQAPQASADDKLKMAKDQARKMIQSDPANYEKSIQEVLKNLKNQLPQVSNRKYLLEADPYYYFSLTMKIANEGKYAYQTKAGQYFNPLMHAPDGFWTLLSWHPYVGWGVGSVIRLFVPQMEWMEAVCWAPIVLSALACFAFFFLSRTLQVDSFQFFIGAVALMLSPIFLQRSGFGWFDTDPYNYIFPFSILAGMFYAIQDSRRTWRGALFSGILTGLYGLFWAGWPFMLMIVPASILVGQGTLRILLKQKNGFENYFRFCKIYLLTSLIAAVVFLTPQGFLQAIQIGVDAIKSFSLAEQDIWPNIFLTVGETRSVSIRKLIFLSGNYITFGVAVLGFVLTGMNAWEKQNQGALSKWFFLSLFSAPLFLLSLKTERFGILFVIPLSIWVMLGAGALRDYAETFLRKFDFFMQFPRLSRALCFVLGCLIFLPLPIVTAHIVSSEVKPIMDDAWYDTMQEIKQKTPEKSIINSWWPPGYFIASLAERRVVADGGTQHLKEVYWLSKILASESEREAVGLLKMLNTTGNRAFLLLKSLNIPEPEAIDLIMSVISLTRQEAEAKLPSEMPESIRKHFLNLTHSETSVPSYVLVYTDMINQNLAVTMISRWNFRKAQQMKNQPHRRREDYVKDFVDMTDGVLKYNAPADLAKREGDILFFSNGALVNLELMDAVIQVPEKNIQGRPRSLFYMKDGKLEEKKMSGEKLLDVSMLLIKEDETYRVVLADSALIRSMMFRFYYLKGEGLQLFKPFSWKRNELNGDQVGVFEMVSE